MDTVSSSAFCFDIIHFHDLIVNFLIPLDINGIFILKIISKYKPVYSQSTNPCKAILLEYVPTFQNVPSIR